MSLLQYTSSEMFSATDLVRKNKSIFDKLQKKDIEKAIILRDGKPSIILMDFAEYEKIMKEYLEFKSHKNEPQQTYIKSNVQKIEQNELKIEKPQEPLKSDEKISLDDYEKAMQDIEKISFSSDFSQDLDNEKNSKPLKEFWEK